MSAVSEMITKMGKLRGPTITTIRVWSDAPPGKPTTLGSELHMHPTDWDAIKCETEIATGTPLPLNFTGTFVGIPVVFGAPEIQYSISPVLEDVAPIQFEVTHHPDGRTTFETRFELHEMPLPDGWKEFEA